MLGKAIFVLLGRPFNFGSGHPNAKIPVDVAIVDLTNGIYSFSQYFVLIFLYLLDITLTGTKPTAVFRKSRPVL
jgi:hypothetical protein